MLNVKPRLSSIFRQICANPATLVAALFIAIAAGTDANARPDLIDGDATIQASTASITELDTGGHVWLELAGYTPVAAVHPQPSSDLLGRLRGGFDLPLDLNPRVQSELNWFVRHPDYLERVFGRAQRYLPYIADEIEARGLPLELALLPVVESAYDPFAYSHGRAAGLWQIIPGTARRFGIRQNWWYDGRRDVVDATRGALEYLAYLHELMDGDWLLAIATRSRAVRQSLKSPSGITPRCHRSAPPTGFEAIPFAPATT